MHDLIVIHYGEIGIKGKNRPFFEDKLVENIKNALNGLKYDFIKRLYGRIIIKLNKESDENEIKNRLINVFGISYFSFAYQTSNDVNEIKGKVLEIVNDVKVKTFRILTKRAYKNYPIESVEVNKRIADGIIKKYNLKVDLDNGELSIWIEILEKNAFIYKEKIEGLKGLPVGVSGKVVALLSGGIDSPVASYLAMKRGCNVVFVHFYNSTINTEGSLNKIKDLVKILNKFQYKSKLYLVPFKEIQDEIIKHVNSKYRMIVYRRFMFLIAEEIAKKENANALLSGENLGQVASQTLSNLKVIEDVVNIPVLRPLITYDKEEVVSLSKKIGLYETSILPYGDCCSFFIAEHPTTKADLSFINKMESKLDINKLIREATKNVEVINQL